MSTVFVNSAVEGPNDEAVAKKLITACGGQVAKTYGLNEKEHVLKHLTGYNQAARREPWLVLVDLDRDACAPQLRAHWLPNPSELMCFRVVVRAIESWLMADREALARYFGISAARVPADPDALSDPKGTLVKLAAKARQVELRSDVVPDPCGGRRSGPGYVFRIAEFVDEYWRPEIAAASSDSLRRCLCGLRQLIERASASCGI